MSSCQIPLLLMFIHVLHARRLKVATAPQTDAAAPFSVSDSYKAQVHGGYQQHRRAIFCIKASENTDDLLPPAAWQLLPVSIDSTTPIHPINRMGALLETGQRARQVLAYFIRVHDESDSKERLCSGEDPIVFTEPVFRNHPIFVGRLDSKNQSHDGEWKAMTSTQPPQAVPLLDEDGHDATVVIDGNGRIQAIRWALAKFRRVARCANMDVQMEMQVAQGVRADMQACFRSRIVSCWKVNVASTQFLKEPPARLTDPRIMEAWYNEWDQEVKHTRSLWYVNPLVYWTPPRQ